jgi:hypothetical protein
MAVQFEQRQDRSLLRTLSLVCAWMVVTFSAQTGTAGEAQQPPVTTEVLPVFFVPRGETPPSAKEKKLVQDHLLWTQNVFRKLLNGKTTFRISRRAPLIIDGEKKLEIYRPLAEGGVPEMLGEVLTHLKQDRFSTPYVFLIVVANRTDDFPHGGGRPINGGHNEGGGVMCFSQFAFNNHPYIQSTLQHEVGHSHGLTHVDAYQYDINSNESLMSYDPKHHTNGIQDSQTPGKLIPEDVRALAINDRGVENLTFSEADDVPANYKLYPFVAALPAMRIAGQPDYAVRLSSRCPNEYSSKIDNFIQKKILPNRGPGVTYDPNFMWHSSSDASGWITVHVTFPRTIALDQFVVYSEHSGQYNRLAAMKVAAGKEGAKQLASEIVDSDEFHIKFPRTELQEWTLSFRPGASGHVTFRGMRFFDGKQEWFTPTYVVP